MSDDSKSCISCGYGDELETLEVWRDKDGEGHWVHPICLELNGKLVG